MPVARAADAARVGARVAIVVLVAVPLAVVDLAVKAGLPTDPLLAHHRSHGWVALSLGLLVLVLLLARLPSRLVAVAAGILGGGVLGNLLSAYLHHAFVPNPFVVGHGGDAVAFNLADVLVLAGLALESAAAMRLAIRYRHLLPTSTVPVRVIRYARASRANRRSA